MSLWVLDTDHLTLFQNDHPRVKQRVEQMNSEEITITVITAEEQMRGWLNAIKKYYQSDRLIWAYKGLRDGLEFFKKVNLLEFDQTAYDCYRDLVSQRVRIGTRDLLIAATVISRNGILVTRNRPDFERVPGLIFEDWTIDESG